MIIAALGVLNVIFAFFKLASIDSISLGSVWGSQGWIPALLLAAGLLALAPLLPKAGRHEFPAFVLAFVGALGALFAIFTVGSQLSNISGRSSSVSIGLILVLIFGLIEAAAAGFSWLTNAGVLGAPGKPSSGGGSLSNSSGAGSSTGSGSSPFGQQGPSSVGGPISAGGATGTFGGPGSSAPGSYGQYAGPGSSSHSGPSTSESGGRGPDGPSFGGGQEGPSYGGGQEGPSYGGYGSSGPSSGPGDAASYGGFAPPSAQPASSSGGDGPGYGGYGPAGPPTGGTHAAPAGPETPAYGEGDVGRTRIVRPGQSDQGPDDGPSPDVTQQVRF